MFTSLARLVQVLAAVVVVSAPAVAQGEGSETPFLGPLDSHAGKTLCTSASSFGPALLVELGPTAGGRTPPPVLPSTQVSDTEARTDMTVTVRVEQGGEDGESGVALVLATDAPAPVAVFVFVAAPAAAAWAPLAAVVMDGEVVVPVCNDIHDLVATGGIGLLVVARGAKVVAAAGAEAEEADPPPCGSMSEGTQALVMTGSPTD